MAVADLVTKPNTQGTTPAELEDALAQVMAGRNCTLCISHIQTRIADVVRDWRAIKDTI